MGVPAGIHWDLVLWGEAALSSCPWGCGSQEGWEGAGALGEAQAGGVQDFEGIWAAERPDAHTGPQRAKAKCTEALLFFSALALIGLAAVGSVPRGPVG